MTAQSSTVYAIFFFFSRKVSVISVRSTTLESRPAKCVAVPVVNWT